MLIRGIITWHAKKLMFSLEWKMLKHAIGKVKMREKYAVTREKGSKEKNGVNQN